MAQPTKHKAGAGMTLTLQILAIPDILAGGAIVAVGLAAGWPQFLDGPPDPVMSGSMGLLMVLQILTRTISLALLSRWTWRLVTNAGKQTRFPLSPRWAWLGWFVPLAGFVIPARALMALNGQAGGVSAWRRLIIMAWWLTRLCTCPLGMFVQFWASIILTLITSKMRAPPEQLMVVNYFAWLAVIGLATRVLEVAVITLTYRHQPKAGEVIAASVF